jgi:UDP-glucose 4-epimerase
MYIFGGDYPTKDGSCVRDYIHIDDLAAAHLAALDYLKEGGKSDVFNCGYGKGYSVKEVIETVKKVSGVDFEAELSPRRAGDPSLLISNNKKILDTLSWKPKYDDLELICKSAYEWESRS